MRAIAALLTAGVVIAQNPGAVVLHDEHCNRPQPQAPAGGDAQLHKKFVEELNNWEKDTLSCLQKAYGEQREVLGKHYGEKLGHLRDVESRDEDEAKDKYSQAKKDISDGEDAEVDAAGLEEKVKLQPQFEKARHWRAEARRRVRVQHYMDWEQAERLACRRWEEAVTMYNIDEQEITNSAHEPWHATAVLECGVMITPIPGTPLPTPAPTPYPTPQPTPMPTPVPAVPEYVGFVPPGEGGDQNVATGQGGDPNQITDAKAGKGDSNVGYTNGASNPKSGIPPPPGHTPVPEPPPVPSVITPVPFTPLEGGAPVAKAKAALKGSMKAVRK